MTSAKDDRKHRDLFWAGLAIDAKVLEEERRRRAAPPPPRRSPQGRVAQRREPTWIPIGRVER